MKIKRKRALQARFGKRGLFKDAGDDGGGGAGAPPATPPADLAPPGEDVSGLKSALEKERAANKANTARLKQLEETFKGVDPAKFAELESLQKQAEQRNQEIAEIKQNAATQYQTQIDAVSTERDRVAGELKSLRSTTAIERAYLNVGGTAEGGDDGVSYFDLFCLNVSPFLKLAEDGKTLEVLDKAGVRRFSEKDSKKFMTTHEFFEGYKTHKVLSNCFPMQNPPKGSGMKPSGRPIVGGTDLTGMTSAQQITYLRNQANANRR
jgi:hypothetical protein